MATSNRNELIRQKLHEFRKEPVRALLALHGGAGREVGPALKAVTTALGMNAEQFVEFRRGTLSFRPHHMERLTKVLNRFRENHADDEIVLGLVNRVDTTYFAHPTRQLITEWIRSAENPAIAEVVAVEEVVEFSNVPAIPFTVLSNAKGTSFVSLPDGTSGELMFSPSGLVTEMKIKVQ